MVENWSFQPLYLGPVGVSALDSWTSAHSPGLALGQIQS